MQVDDGLDIDTLEALKNYLAFCKDITGKTPHIKLSGFKAALKAAFPSVEFGNRTKGAHRNRAYIKGIGHARQDFSDAGNVVQLPVQPIVPINPSSKEK